MPRDGAIIFGDLIGKLDVLRVLGTFCPLAVLWAEVKSRGGNYVAKKRKAKKPIIKRKRKAKKRTAKKPIIKPKRIAQQSKPKKWSSPKLDVFGPVVLDADER
jgi:hypothetical protein